MFGRSSDEMRVVYGGSDKEFAELMQIMNLGRDERVAYDRSHRWDEFERERDPQFPDRVFGLLAREHVLPEDYNGFVFLSVSANRAHIEEGLARNIDARVRDQHLDKKPLVIASDIAGARVDGRFRPICADKELPTFEHVNFVCLASDARRMPIKSGEADIIWDRLGAMWHIGAHVDDDEKKTRKGNLSQEDYRQIAILLFEKYSKLLKENGKIVLDAYELKDMQMPDSTATGLLYFFDTYYEGDCLDREREGNFARALAAIGLRYRFIGQHMDRLMVVEKIKDN